MSIDSPVFRELNEHMVLTQNDIEQIEEIVTERVREEIKHLPTKDEFYTKMGEVMGELIHPAGQHPAA